ncbi:hypothetical protein SESBI_08161 [Sesbania bispinosa]|nr:hypothetical protein SESBI_08161 [Sesbania bispinosa]
MERVVNGKRYNESEADYESRHKLPRLKMKKAPMLVQAPTFTLQKYLRNSKRNMRNIKALA